MLEFAGSRVMILTFCFDDGFEGPSTTMQPAKTNDVHTDKNSVRNVFLTRLKYRSRQTSKVITACNRKWCGNPVHPALRCRRVISSIVKRAVLSADGIFDGKDLCGRPE